MVLKYNWVMRRGGAGGSPKFAYAYYGISPFAMLDLSVDVIVDMNLTEYFLHEASAVTPKDLKTSKDKLVVTVPMDGFKWQK